MRQLLQAPDSFVIILYLCRFFSNFFSVLLPNIFQTGQKHYESCEEMFVDPIKVEPFSRLHSVLMITFKIVPSKQNRWIQS